MDEEAWYELGELQLTECEWQKAATCYDELILHDPHNFLCMMKYAEVCPGHPNCPQRIAISHSVCSLGGLSGSLVHPR